MFVDNPPYGAVDLRTLYNVVTCSQKQVNESINLYNLELELNRQRPMIFQGLQTECCIIKDIPKKSNCKNCGASLEGKHGCSYCGTYNE